MASHRPCPYHISNTMREICDEKVPTKAFAEASTWMSKMRSSSAFCEYRVLRSPEFFAPNRARTEMIQLITKRLSLFIIISHSIVQ